MKTGGSTRILFSIVFTVMIFVFAVQASADTTALLREAIQHYNRPGTISLPIPETSL